MYKVIYNPGKCKIDGYLKMKYNQPIELKVGDGKFSYHNKCGCMDIIEHYKLVTISKSQKPGTTTIVRKREKIIIEDEKVDKEKI